MSFLPHVGHFSVYFYLLLSAKCCLVYFELGCGLDAHFSSEAAKGTLVSSLIQNIWQHLPYALPPYSVPIQLEHHLAQPSSYAGL